MKERLAIPLFVTSPMGSIGSVHLSHFIFRFWLLIINTMYFNVVKIGTEWYTEKDEAILVDKFLDIAVPIH